MTENTEEEKTKKENNVKKQNFILRFLKWLAQGAEDEAKKNSFCST